MKRILWILACAGLSLTLAVAAPAGELLDRIVAAVNGQIILQSDWQDAVRYEAFVEKKSMDQFSDLDLKAALDHLIDQELLREQMRSSSFQHATDEEVLGRVQEIRKQYAGSESEAGWHAVLVGHGFSEDELKQRVALQLDLMRLVDAHLRPNVNVDSKSIEGYYNQQLLPQLRQSGAKEVPLAEVSPQIKELLTQQKVNQLLVAWLQSLRSGSDIRTETTPSSYRGELR